MNNTGSQVISSRPGIFQPLKAGFNVAANHMGLLLFPILLDLWLWLGVHFTLSTQMSGLISEFKQYLTGPTDQIDQIISAATELFVERLNIMTALRSYPVGVPSLMSGRLPISSPIGLPISIEFPSINIGIIGFLLCTIVGLAIGTFYYQVVSRAALKGNPGWVKSLRDWPWTFWQVITLALVWLVLGFLISIPFSCVIPVISIGGLSQLAMFFYMAIFVWIFFPLLFSAHAIFVSREKMFSSFMKSINLTRLTLPITTMFILIAFSISQGFDIVWGWPAEDSWMVLIGLVGHSFVTTGLLAASFLYYRDADQWAQNIVRQVILKKNS